MAKIFSNSVACESSPIRDKAAAARASSPPCFYDGGWSMGERRSRGAVTTIPVLDYVTPTQQTLRTTKFVHLKETEGNWPRIPTLGNKLKILIWIYALNRNGSGHRISLCALITRY